MDAIQTNGHALGLIETAGYGAAIFAADAALKAAAVRVVRLEPTIGSGGSLGVTVFLRGEVAAVHAAVSAGQAEANRVGRAVSADVIPSLDPNVQTGMFHGTLKL